MDSAGNVAREASILAGVASPSLPPESDSTSARSDVLRSLAGYEA